MSALPMVPANSGGALVAASVGAAALDAVSGEPAGPVDVTLPQTAATNLDFSTLIANLSQLEIPVATAANGAPVATVASEVVGTKGRSADTPEDSDADPVETDSDLQAALAAMSMLPWPVAREQPAPTAEQATVVDVQQGSAEEPLQEAHSRPVPTRSNVASPPTPAESPLLSLQQNAPDGRLPLSGTASISDATHKADAPRVADIQIVPLERPDSRVFGELRTGFSTVMSEAAGNSRPERLISVPVHDARWPTAIAHEIRWSVQAGVQSATLRLVPENLGPVEMRVNLQDNQVNVSFSSAQQDTRVALEQSLPRLREMLSASGLTLGQANVQQEARGESHFRPATSRLAVDRTVEAEVQIMRVAIGLVDEYA